MGTVFASAIMADAGVTLLDTANVRWTDSEKFGYLNDGQRLICLYKSDAHIIIDSYQLVKGTKQRLPDGTSSYLNPLSTTLEEGLRLLKVIRNIGSGSLTFGELDTNTSSDTITLTAHGLTVGTMAVLSTDGTLPDPLSEGTIYYVIVLNVDTIQLATNLANALIADPIDLDDRGSVGATHTVTTPGTDPGDAIFETDMQTLDNNAPSWHSSSPGAVVQSSVYDERFPDNFYVYPPQPSTDQGYIEIAFSALVADVDPDAGTNIWNAAAGSFTAGTYAWSGNGSNTIANVNNRLRVTFVDNATGATNNLNAVADLSEDLEPGVTYVLMFDARKLWSILEPLLRVTVGEGGVVKESSDLIGAVMSRFSIEFVATSANNMNVQFSGLSAGASAEMDNIILLKKTLYNTAINLSDRFESTLYDYMMYRCYEKDAALSQFNAARSVYFWNLFVTELGRLDLIKKVVSPNRQQPKPSPAIDEDK